MVLNTFTVGLSVTPTVVKTYASHVRNRASDVVDAKLYSISIGNLVHKNQLRIFPTMKVSH